MKAFFPGVHSRSMEGEVMGGCLAYYSDINTHLKMMRFYVNAETGGGLSVFPDSETEQIE